MKPRRFPPRPRLEEPRITPTRDAYYNAATDQWLTTQEWTLKGTKK